MLFRSHLEWTYDGAFEQLFGLGRGEFEQKFSQKFKCPGGWPGGMLKLRFDWYITNIALSNFLSQQNGKNVPQWQICSVTSPLVETFFPALFSKRFLGIITFTFDRFPLGQKMFRSSHTLANFRVISITPGLKLKKT